MNAKKPEHRASGSFTNILLWVSAKSPFWKHKSKDETSQGTFATNCTGKKSSKIHRETGSASLNQSIFIY